MTTFHLWRKYQAAPYYRWACEVAPDAEAPDGYRVLRSDPIVADSAFFHRLAAALTAEHEVLTMKADAGKVVHSAERVRPGSEDYFDHAVRKVVGSILGQSPEYMARVNAGSAS
jgi:hypothetical protein